jgi:sn-glycerol 3-phosphate transport system ATP-binding protein
MSGNELKPFASSPVEHGILGIRPEDLAITPGPAPAGGIELELLVDAIERVGPETFVYGSRTHGNSAPAVGSTPGELPPGEIIVRVPGQDAPAIGERIRAAAPRDKLHLFSADGRSRLDG